jgi:hypothetical protein
VGDGAGPATAAVLGAVSGAASAEGEGSGAPSGAVTGIGAVTGAMVEDGGYRLGEDVVEPVPFGVVRKLISL